VQGKRLLIIGAGSEQLPAIRLARAFGLTVLASDRNPHAPGAAEAHHFAAISTDDKEGNLAWARALAIDGVMTTGSETAVPVVAHIAATLGLPGITPATAHLATNKNAMRDAFARHGVPAPASQAVTTLDEVVAFVKRHPLPLVIKPSDNSGQRGTTLVREPDDLPAALAAALEFAGDGRAIIESFIHGPEINVTAIVQQGEIEILSLSERITAAPPHFGIALQHLAPPRITPEMAMAIAEVSRAAIRAIGLHEGIAYPQLIAAPLGPQVIEIAARIPGGYMREVALCQSGIDLIEVAMRQALGESLPFDAYRHHPRSAAVAVRFYTALDLPPQAVSVAEISGFDLAATHPGVVLAHSRLEAGSAIPPLTSSAARFGAIIVTADDSATLTKRLHHAEAVIRLVAA
jgi:biotin carboxylase